MYILHGQNHNSGSARANIQFIITHAGSTIYFTTTMYTTFPLKKKTMYMTFEKLSVSSKATTEQTMRTLPH